MQLAFRCKNNAVWRRWISQFRQVYEKEAQERAKSGIPPLPLSATEVKDVVEILQKKNHEDLAFAKELLIHRTPAGVDDAAREKASFLNAITTGQITSESVSKQEATKLLGTMLGGYNVTPLVHLLDDPSLAPIAVEGLSNTLLVFDAFNDVAEKRRNGNKFAQQVMENWANATYFHKRPKVPEIISVCVFKVTGETNTDDLSPAQSAWSRPDIPLHATVMLANERDGIYDALNQIEELKTKSKLPLAYVGDVVGTGSSRKSATNSINWLMGRDLPYVPNKRTGSIVLGTTIAPIFFNTMEDSGALPIEVDCSKLNMGDLIDIYPYDGKICKHGTNDVVVKFALRSEVLLDEFQAGGRIPLIILRGLTQRARDELDLPRADFYRRPPSIEKKVKGYTLAQKLVGKACGLPGIQPGEYCEPQMSSVGSQDTTGPMTRDELKDLACLGFSADLVMQSFCHTAAYPKPVDVTTHKTLPDFMDSRGGVVLRAGDGIIHSWLNRMLIPDKVGTGGDSHTRFPLGISFPAGSGLVAFAAATGVMPLDMPESVLVRFHGDIQPGVTLRDIVHSIPYVALQKGLLTVEKKGKKNIFNGRILEIEGLPDLKVEQAFELSDASAERSAAGCTIKLNKEPIAEYLTSNITLLKWMIAEGYTCERTLKRRIERMEEWLGDQELMVADKQAEYKEIIEIDLNQITEPLLCCPNDPDDVKPLSAVTGTKIDEVFIGSCMTNIGHFRAAGEMLKAVDSELSTRLWIAPPTKMDEAQLRSEGYYAIFGKVGARLEIPGCSLCMGNQARVLEKASVVSTSTRNFPNRLGKGANVYLASAELSAVTALLGRLPTHAEYMNQYATLEDKKEQTYKYLNFDQVVSFVEAAKTVNMAQ
eukprot:GEMP01005189.1.p1 GENE.GEMP01005189.1~~GEMP01005189.1.p1  ORF type:complete len:877 (+),score=204.76 GEMP01005189.1:161-2791(+)